MSSRPHPVHFEPFLHLADVDDDQALIAWGGFWFTPHRDGDGWRILDDEELGRVSPGRQESIGVRSEPYGRATVRARTPDGRVAAEERVDDRNHVWLRGLQPATEYRYEVEVDGRRWDPPECMRWHRIADHRGELRPAGRGYDLRFRTFPDPTDDDARTLSFAALGDYGVGIQARPPRGDHQRHVADVLTRLVEAGRVLVVVTLGDNIYLGEEDSASGTGDEDDDWYFSFYEPYRFVISRVPVYPTVGNHDGAETEASDDRDQLADNHFTGLRFTKEVEADRAVVGTTTDRHPGLFYRFCWGRLVEFCSIDTSHACEDGAPRYFDDEAHQPFLDETFTTDRTDRPAWLVPFMHHPFYCAGPSHTNDDDLARSLGRRFAAAGVRLVLAGHEHNFQHTFADGVHHVVSGAGGKLRDEPPTGFEAARTQSWASEPHLLLADVTPEQIVVSPVRTLDDRGELVLIDARRPDGSPAPLPIVVTR